MLEIQEMQKSNLTLEPQIFMNRMRKETRMTDSLQDKGRNQWDIQLSGAGRDHLTKVTFPR